MIKQDGHAQKIPESGILINQLIYLTIGVCLTVLFATKFSLALSHFKLTRQELQNLAVFDTLKMSDRQFSLILK